MISELFETAANAIIEWQNERTEENREKANKALKQLQRIPMDWHTVKVVLGHIISEKRGVKVVL